MAAGVNGAPRAPAARPELLAPAGDWDALKAAVGNGADAVYFGLPRFSARQRATNFAVEELPAVFRYLHDHNTRGYVAFNTLVFSSELPQAVDWVLRIAEAGADAVIVQDLGLARVIRATVPELPLHASTQTTQTEAEGIRLLADLGVRRVILARELSLDDLASLARALGVVDGRGAPGMELEVFVHGALCVSYSGQCLASEALWGRSGNRGLCAQACRLPWRLVVDGRPVDTGDRRYLLSLPDLAAWDRVERLVRLGIACFKIEGRLKGPEYVAAATRTYRAAIDAAVQGRPFELPEAQQLELVQSFSRGFSHGWLDGVDHQRSVPGSFARHLGVRAGKVLGTTQRGVVIELDSRLAASGGPLKAGDGVVFHDDRDQRDQQGGRIYAIDPAPPRWHRKDRRAVELKFRQGDVALASIQAGTEVHRTDDPGLRRALKGSWNRDRVVRRVRIGARVTATPGQELVLDLTDDEGRTARAAWEGPLTPAVKHPLTVKRLSEQLGRLGSTPFELESVELIGPDGPGDSLDVMVPVSVLNELRRKAAAELVERRSDRTRYRVIDPRALERLRREAASTPCPRGGPEGPEVRLDVLARSVEQVEALAGSGPVPCARFLFLELEDPAALDRCVRTARAAGLGVGLVTRRIIKPGEEPYLDELLALKPDALLVRTPGALRLLHGREACPVLVGDASFNVANEVCVDTLVSRGLSRVTASHDANAVQLAGLLDAPGAKRVDVVVYHRIAMIHMEHCLAAAHLSGGHDRSDCGCPCRAHELALRDQAGADHPVRVEATCRNTVYTAHVQSALKQVPDLVARRVRHLRIELLDETGDEACGLVSLHHRLIASAVAPEAAWRELRSLVRARVTPGTLEME